MTAMQPIVFIGMGFMAFALVLLVVPGVMVLKKVKPWKDVSGLWIAGCGFALIGVGTVFAHRGLGALVIPGVIVTTAGHLMQRRVMNR